MSEKADRATPAKYDIPFAAGFAGRAGRANAYAKSQENTIHLEFSFEKTSGTSIVEGETVFTLPAGFRPSGNVYRTIVGLNASGTAATPVQLRVMPNGEAAIITMAPTSMTTVTMAHGGIEFIAAL